MLRAATTVTASATPAPTATGQTARRRSRPARGARSTAGATATPSRNPSATAGLDAVATKSSVRLPPSAVFRASQPAVVTAHASAPATRPAAGPRGGRRTAMSATAAVHAPAAAHT